MDIQNILLLILRENVPYINMYEVRLHTGVKRAKEKYELTLQNRNLKHKLINVTRNNNLIALNGIFSKPH